MTRALLPFVCSGTIPKSLGELTKLKWLNLEGNKLEGPIPEGIAKLSSGLDQQGLVLNQAALVIQAHCRGYIVRIESGEQQRAATTVQKHVRGHQGRKVLSASRKGAILVQRQMRRFAVQHNLHDLLRA